MALPRYVGNWQWPVPASGDPDFDLYVALNAAGAVVSDYRALRDKIARDWKLNPDRDFREQGAPALIVERAQRELTTETRKLLTAAEKKRETPNLNKRRASLRENLGLAIDNKLGVKPGPSSDPIGDMRMAFMDVLGIRDFAGLSPAEKSRYLADLASNGDWREVKVLIDAPAARTKMDPRVRAEWTAHLREALAPSFHRDLTELDVKEQTVAEAWDIALRGVRQDSGLDAADHQAAVAARRAEHGITGDGAEPVVVANSGGGFTPAQGGN